MTFIAGGSNQNIGMMKMPIKTNNWDLETLLETIKDKYCEKNVTYWKWKLLLLIRLKLFQICWICIL